MTENAKPKFTKCTVRRSTDTFATGNRYWVSFDGRRTVGTVTASQSGRTGSTWSARTTGPASTAKWFHGFETRAAAAEALRPKS